MAVEVLGLVLSPTWVLACGAISLFFLYDNWCHNFWQRRGVPAVPAWPVVGNLPEFRVGIATAVRELAARHGRVYGFYDNRLPAVVCGDPDMVKQVMVKSFNHFVNRRKLPINNKETEEAVGNLRDDHWRNVRNMIAPAFSGSKMKQMSPMVKEIADRMVENIRKYQEADGYFECKQVYGSFVMDTIASCTFGLDVDSHADPDNPFVAHGKKAFEVSLTNLGLIIATFLPWTSPILKFFNFTLFPRDSIGFFRDVAQKAIEIRKAPNADRQKSKKVDLLQIIVDAQKSEGEDDVENETDIHDAIFELHEDTSQNRKRRSEVKLTDSEIMAQAVIFFIGGYDTTGGLLVFASYLLALHTDVQEKLIAEIDELLPSGDDVGYTTVSKLPYLDNVICETLRCYPPTPVVDRDCNKPFTYNGTTIPEGTRVIIPIYAIHHDPELWPEPDKFDPDRFTKEERDKRHPFSWLPWGGGPRICLGMRFALMGAKVALVKVLQNYRLETCSQTKIPLELGKAGLLTPAHDVLLRARPRTAGEQNDC
ncbi:cytochrome P450 3A6-like [Diadema setosum]|uniref:cytochrome P450 3A6-like n=1 Tax=Diadema setosum TaxID=31175 RepID=UPI003B3B11AD